MAYQVLLKRSAEKELSRLPVVIHDRIVAQLIALQDNPRPARVRKLRGREGYRLRVGDYRVLFVINDTDQQIDVFSVAHRREVYR